MTNNQDLWGEARDILKTRPVLVSIIKVKGHSTPLDIQMGRSTIRKAYMNDQADDQAGKGAARAQLPPSVTQVIEALVLKSKRVHSRLVEVAQVRFAEKRKDFVKPPRSIPRPVVPRWEKVFLARAANSDHRVVRFGPSKSQVKCTLCSKSGKVKAASKWLLSKCTVALHERVDGQVLHPSHAMASRQGVRMCQVCGCYSVKRVVKLLLPCSGKAGGVQKADLERWGKGLPPKQVEKWPLGL